MTKTRRLSAIVLGALTLGNAAGDAHLESAMYVYTFADLCRRELPAKQQSLFYAELGRAEQAIAAGNVRDAEQAMNNAQGASWRGADFDQKASNDVGVKCLGEQTASRWHTARLGLYRLLDSEYPNDSDRVWQTNLILTANDGGSDVLVNEIRSEPASRFRGAVGALEGITRQVDTDREFGAYILAGENQVATACRDASRQLRKLADQKHRAALAAEDTAFNRQPTEQETSMARAATSAEAAASAIMGVELGDADRDEVMLVGIRVGESQRHLEDARDWNLEQYDDPARRPSSQRALKRGDSMLAQANDTARSLAVRDDFYGLALQYFRFGSLDDREAEAASRQAAIQPALEAEQARREQQREAALEQKAGAMQQAVEDMQKTEAEKKSFNEEADAMEAELGF